MCGMCSCARSPLRLISVGVAVAFWRRSNRKCRWDAARLGWSTVVIIIITIASIIKTGQRVNALSDIHAQGRRRCCVFSS